MHLTIADWIGIISFLVAIELAIGHGTVSLSNAVPEKWVPRVQAWCNILAFVGSSLVAVLSRMAVVAIVAVLVLGAGQATAQTARKPATPKPAAVDIQGSSESATLTKYTEGKAFRLRLLNPLGLPDPLCITDHPSGACATSGNTTGGMQMSGDPNKDLATFLQHGDIALIRDMMRADQYLSYPCKADSTNLDAQGNACTKTDLLGSSCLEAIIPVAKMVVNGPPVSGSTSSGGTSSPSTAAPAQPDPNTAPVRMSTDTPPIDKLDEGVITSLAKQAIVLNALQSPQLTQGCGGFIQQKIKNVISLGAGIMTFVTTLGLTGA